MKRKLDAIVSSFLFYPKLIYIITMKRSETSAFFSCAERTRTRIKQNKHNKYQGRRNSTRLPCFHIYNTFKKRRWWTIKQFKHLNEMAKYLIPKGYPAFSAEKIIINADGTINLKLLDEKQIKHLKSMLWSFADTRAYA